MIPDVLQIKTVEKEIGRKLYAVERYGFKSIKLNNGKLVKIAQVSIQWLHSNNSCK